MDGHLWLHEEANQRGYSKSRVTHLQNHTDLREKGLKRPTGQFRHEHGEPQIVQRIFQLDKQKSHPKGHRFKRCSLRRSPAEKPQEENEGDTHRIHEAIESIKADQRQSHL